MTTKSTFVDLKRDCSLKFTAFANDVLPLHIAQVQSMIDHNRALQPPYYGVVKVYSKLQVLDLLQHLTTVRLFISIYSPSNATPNMLKFLKGKLPRKIRRLERRMRDLQYKIATDRVITVPRINLALYELYGTLVAFLSLIHDLGSASNQPAP